MMVEKSQATPPPSGTASDAGAARHLTARRALATFLALVVLVLLGLWDVGVFGGNVRTVVPGRVYRSAQLTGHNLDAVLATHHIRTVINLRGAESQERWYRSELATCARRGVAHEDVGLSATHLPPPPQLRRLLSDFDRARYPVLFHCQAGADRLGLVGTVYLNVYEHVPIDRAEAAQLTWRYGHLPFGKARPMNDFFRLYRRTGGGMGLREWIVRRYPTVYAAQPAGERTE